MNSDWLYEAIARQKKYNAGYEDGYRAGTCVAAALIFEDIDKLHLHVANEYEARAYEELKKKYKVKYQGYNFKED
jgi:hypothetical protein